jgi:amino acid adenylation domain-containing protein
MSTDQLLEELSRLKVELSLADGGQLKIVAPEGSVDGLILGAIREHKPSLLKYLQDKAVYPVSYAQRRIYILHQLDETHFAYNIFFSHRLQMGVDKTALQTAIWRLVERHEILRTVFREQTDGLWQVARDVTESGVILGETELDPNSPFDLQAGPLFRIHLVQRGKDDYLLELCLHHIIADGWSLNVLMEELIGLYEAACAGQVSDLDPLPLQYRDFAVWQNGLFESGKMDDAKNYWKEKLSDPLPVLALATDHPRPARLSYAGSERTLCFEGEELAVLRAGLREQAGTSLFMLFVACVRVLLYRYTGQEDVLLGTPVAGRTTENLTGLIGCFVNTLVLRTVCSPGESFSALLDRVREDILDACVHEEYPFDKLVEELGIQTDRSRSALFDVMVTYRRLDGGAASVTDYDISKFDLTLHIEEQGENIVLLVNYKTDLFAAPRIDRMLGHLKNILLAVSRDVSIVIGDIPLLGEAEEKLLRFGFNATDRYYPSGSSLVDLFRLHQRETVAVRMGDEMLDYASLDNLSDGLAATLQLQYGVTKGKRVGIMMDRSPRMIATLLAILKCGAAYVPVDAAYPAERINYIVADSGMSLLLTDDRPLAPSMPLTPVKVGPADTAYIIYTSGSTGNPKGVEVTHRSLVNLCCWHKEAFGLTTSSRATVYAGTAFDASGWEIWPYLLAGASLYPVPAGIRKDAPALSEFLTTNAITHTFLPTALYEEMGGSLTLPADGRLRILTGGDKLQTVYPGPEVFNNYGPTENTVVTTSGFCLPGDGRITIGRPIANTRVYILDKGLRLVPLGYPGELCIAGDGLAKGYLNREQLTKEKFIDHPFEPGQRLYRTGDLARWTGDGEIEFLGRNDHQVKIRGFRIELGEVQQALSSYPGVREAVVLAVGEGAGEKSLAGYITWKDGADEQGLRGFLETRLPAYMVPAAFVSLSQFPLTANGKIDRMQLPSPIRPTALAPAAARNATEARLVELWEEALHPGVGIYDNFFSSGGHSLKGMRLMAAVSAAFGRRVSIKELYEYPDIAAMAAWLRGQDKGGDTLLFRLAPPAEKVAQPAIFIPPVMGSATIYRPLAEALKDRFDCYGVIYPGFNGGPFAESIEAMALVYAQQITDVIPAGPFLLFGYSVGALVAFETARQLEAMGEKVSLVLVDKESPFWLERLEMPTDAELDQFFQREKRGWAGDQPLADEKHYRALYKAYYRNMVAYRPTASLRARIYTFEASEGHDRKDPRMQGWAGLTNGEFAHHWLEGDHYRVLQDPALPAKLLQLRKCFSACCASCARMNS